MTAAAASRRLVVVVVMCTAPCSAAAQSPAAVVDNFEHGRRTELAAFGELGSVEIIGTGGEPMILIAGAPFGSAVWERFMARNADRYTMYAVTLPGYGGTRPWALPAGPVRSDGLRDYGQPVWSAAAADAIATLIAKNGLKRPVVVTNHLIADHVGLLLASRHRDAVGGLVISASSPGSRVPAEFSTREQWIYDDRVPFLRAVSVQEWRANMTRPPRLTTDSTLWPTLQRAQFEADVPSQIQYFLEYLAADQRALLAGLAVPMLVLEVTPQFGTLPESVRNQLLASAGGDSVAARTNYESRSAWQVATAGTPPRIIRIPDTGILMMHDQPDQFDRAIAEFVRSLR